MGQCSSENNGCAGCAPNLQLFTAGYYFNLRKIGFSELTNPFSSKKYLNMSKDYHMYDNYIATRRENVKLRAECVGKNQPFCACSSTRTITNGTSATRTSSYSREISNNGELYTVYKTTADAKITDYKDGGTECNFCESKPACGGNCHRLGTKATTVLEIKSSDSCYKQNIISQSCSTWQGDGSGGSRLVNCNTLATELFDDNPVCSAAYFRCKVTPTNISVNYCPDQNNCSHNSGNVDGSWGQYGCFDIQSYWVGSWSSYANQTLSEEYTCENLIEDALKLKEKLIDIYSDNKILGDCSPSRCGGAPLDNLNIGKDNCWGALYEGGGFYLSSSSCVDSINANGMKIKIATPKEGFKKGKEVGGKVIIYIPNQNDLNEGRTPCCNSESFGGTILKEFFYNLSASSLTFKDNFLAVDVGELHSLEDIVEKTTVVYPCITVDSVFGF